MAVVVLAAAGAMVGCGGGADAQADGATVDASGADAPTSAYVDDAGVCHAPLEDIEHPDAGWNHVCEGTYQAGLAAGCIDAAVAAGVCGGRRVVLEMQSIAGYTLCYYDTSEGKLVGAYVSFDTPVYCGQRAAVLQAGVVPDGCATMPTGKLACGDAGAGD